MSAKRTRCIYAGRWNDQRPLAPMKSKETPWWKCQFLDATINEIIFGWKTNTKAEVDTILGKMRLPAGAQILDLACEQGRHSIELARRGFRVTGLDYSPLLLSQAVAASKKLPESRRPIFIEGDMREIKRIFPSQKFDAFVNLWNAWGYFDRRSDDRKTLAGISHILVPGGFLVVNTLNEDGVIRRLKSYTLGFSGSRCAVRGACVSESARRYFSLAARERGSGFD